MNSYIIIGILRNPAGKKCGWMVLFYCINFGCLSPKEKSLKLCVLPLKVLLMLQELETITSLWVKEIYLPSVVIDFSALKHYSPLTACSVVLFVIISSHIQIFLIIHSSVLHDTILFCVNQAAIAPSHIKSRTFNTYLMLYKYNLVELLLCLLAAALVSVLWRMETANVSVHQMHDRLMSRFYTPGTDDEANRWVLYWSAYHIGWNFHLFSSITKKMGWRQIAYFLPLYSK